MSFVTIRPPVLFESSNRIQFLSFRTRTWGQPACSFFWMSDPQSLWTPLGAPRSPWSGPSTFFIQAYAYGITLRYSVLKY